jgi:hypothetical protein
VDQTAEHPCAASGASSCGVPEVREVRRYPRFLLAALLLTLTFGATLGMVKLARLTGTWGPLARESVWAHAYTQVFGFLALFIMGFASHALPRFMGTRLRHGGLLSACLWLQVGGVLAVVTSLLAGPPLPAAAALRVAGTGALLLSSMLFALVAMSTTWARGVAPDPVRDWMTAGTSWLVVVSGLALVSALRQDESWHVVMWPAGLLGFGGSCLFGVARRLFPASLGFRPTASRWERPTWLLYQAGVAAWAAGAWSIDADAQVARIAGAAALLVAIPAYAVTLGLLRPRRIPWRLLAGEHRDYARFVHAAWGWLFVALAAGPAWTLAARLTGDYEPALLVDFARHAFALGFLTQTILGVGGRIVPFFSGGRIWSPRAHRLCFWLLNAAVAVRGLEALSGPPAVLAVGLFSVNLVTGMRPAASRGAARVPARPGGRIPAALGSRRALSVRPD